MIKQLHIGEEIKRISESQGMNAQKIADVLGCHRNNVYRLFKTETIDTGDLAKISVLLKHDFFEHYSQQIKSLLPDVTPIDTNDRLSQLEKDMADIKAKLADKFFH